MSVIRFNSLPHITSCISKSSFPVRTEFSLRNPSLHSHFNLGKVWIERMKLRRAAEGSCEMFNSHPMWQHKIPTDLQSV
ncbi:hypothetical protein MtrunA17_Chr6g0480371 [Medicago truncatula]|uniref:Uncharacterized protein n=1 Tax=Medicago truncatula TaxID=3880 RepID=A0A072UBE6_MEDTR|nr:hypothetical protein MTR_6g074775 [Medicago truncatula]RHN52422.1 hypothetical protein MtrunA17_Chr6g0480371 [Medicago truncatula]